MAYKESTIHASAARTATSIATEPIDTFQGAVDGHKNPNCRFFLDITAVSGTTPTLVLELWGTINGVDFLLGAFASKNAAGKDTIVIADCPRYVKPRWVVGGTTPSFTFNVQASRS